jgi:hypothetical protein
MSLLNKNKNMPIVIIQSTFYTKNDRKREGVKLEKTLCMTYHRHNLTCNSFGEFLELVYCDLNPILMKQTTQIGYVVEVISLSCTLTKNALHMLNW